MNQIHTIPLRPFTASDAGRPLCNEIDDGAPARGFQMQSARTNGASYLYPALALFALFIAIGAATLAIRCAIWLIAFQV